MGRVSGKVAIVTGAARGLGAAFAKLLAEEGAQVMLTDVLEAEGQAAAKALGGRARFLRLDVAQEADWLRVIKETEAEFGPVTVLVNNAGIASSGPSDTLTVEDYRKVIDINQTGVFLGMKSVTPSMRKAGSGSIINISSIYGLRGSAKTMAYTAAKFAVRGMTKVAALELVADKIRVNSIHPGFIHTPMADASDMMDQLIPTIPAQRLGEPNELAPMVLLLASDEMKYATGAEFVIDGGWSCG